jgi:hypothetical protein
MRPSTTNPDIGNTGPRKVLVYGAPGSGKTPLITSLPWGKVWGEKALYVPCDQKENHLAGVAENNRERLVVADYGNAPDPYSYIKSVLAHDWSDEGIGTIIIDTATNLARNYLAAAITSGGYNTKSIPFGAELIKLADKPHYGLAHNLMAKTINHIKDCKLNVIVSFWAGYDQPGGGEAGAFGGPITVNMSFSRDVAGEFGTIIYTRSTSEGGKQQYYAHTENYGIWVARLPGVIPNPIPQIRMEPNPVHVWNQIDKAQGIGL